MSVIEALLPAGVEAQEAFDDRLVEPLFPQEESAIANAVDRRRREFTTVRACARTALARLGVPPAPIVPGRRGAPGWPVGVVGSLTHCDGYRAAVVARSGHAAAIGIDAEPHDPLPQLVLAAIALPQERIRLARLAESASQVCWDRLLFSAKESVYKAWFPLTGHWLDYDQAEITFYPVGRFTAELFAEGAVLGARQPTHFEGRWLAGDRLVITAIVEMVRAS